MLSTTNLFEGVKASPGVTVGPVVKLDRGAAGLHRIVSDPSRERALYEAAIVLAKDELRRLQQRATGPEADIFIFQIALLEDESFTNEIGDYIAAGAGSAVSVERAEQIFAERLSNVDDDYIRERSVDVRDACRRVVDILDGRPRKKLTLKTPSIVVADLFFPSDLVSVERGMILGFASEAGSVTSHAAIMARSMGIPAVCQLGGGVADAADGRMAVLDAQSGTLLLDPSPEALAQANHKIAQQQRHSGKKDPLAGKPCFTRDGTAFQLWANCVGPEEIENAMGAGATGIGLVRCEALLAKDALPNEDEQYFHYVSCLAAAGGAPVTVRTFDLERPAGEGSPVPGMSMPGLGMRGMRILYAHRELFDTQICALLRAGARGDLRVALPMIGGPEDWDECMREVERCKERLRKKGVPFAQNLPFGCLVEVPSAALTCDEILDHGAQFLTIGTNDLVQYTCAADRADERMARFYRVDSPAVKKLVGLSYREAKRRHRPVCLCGVSAERPKQAEGYLRTGLHTFSVEVSSLHELKQHLLNCSLTQERATPKK